jgi:UDP-N-acetylglucosamine 3-dehydrogenase
VKRVLRAGVIGIGAMGRNHARIYFESPATKLIGIADTDEKRVTSVAQNYDCEAYTSYETLIEQNLDTVSVVVPTILHKKVAMDAIDKGINVLVEKPIADTLADAEDIIEAAHRKGVKLMVGHIERFNPAIIKLRELIEKGQLGNIISISAKRVGPYNPRIRDVGIILDLGTHDIDIMSYLSGEKIKEVYASAGSSVHNHEDHAIITLNFANGSNGLIETNWFTPHKVRTLTVVGSKGIAEVNYIEVTLRLFDREWVREAKIEKEEPLKLEIEHFIDCIKRDKEPLVSGQDGTLVLKVAIKAVEASISGKVCQIE